MTPLVEIYRLAREHGVRVCPHRGSDVAMGGAGSLRSFSPLLLSLLLFSPALLFPLLPSPFLPSPLLLFPYLLAC